MSDVSLVLECAICGRNRALVYRWYQYDNGEQTRVRVCLACADLHSSLVKGK
jgi:protein-arginine kinase activator protein McsA